MKLFNEIYQRQKAELEAKEKTPITVTLKDGKKIEGFIQINILGKKWVTTPMMIAVGINKKLAENMVAAKVIYDSLFDKSMNIYIGKDFVDVDLDD